MKDAAEVELSSGDNFGFDVRLSHIDSRPGGCGTLEQDNDLKIREVLLTFEFVEGGIFVDLMTYLDGPHHVDEVVAHVGGVLHAEGQVLHESLGSTSLL